MSSSHSQVTDFPLSGIQLLEASAGTGKTWNISSLYVRLILGHGRAEAALLPNQILVVTFTKAATQELQDRIRNRLNEVAEFLRRLEGEEYPPTGSASPATASGDALLEGLRAYYGNHPEKRAPHAYRLSLAADSMDDAAIFTIHGWCQRILKQHAFDSGSLFDLTIETDEADLLRECVRDYWRTAIYPLAKEDLTRIHTLSKDPESLLKKVRGLLSLPPETREDLKLSYPSTPDGLHAALAAWSDWEQRISEAEARVRSQWAFECERIPRIIQDALNSKTLNARVYNKNVHQWIEGITAWAKDPGIPTTTGLKLKNFAQGQFNLNPQGSGQEPQSPAFVAIADYLAIIGDVTVKDALKAALIASSTVWIRERFEHTKHDRAVIDQNDLVLKLHEAIKGAGGARLADIIQKQYPVALIDEFQDTDPLQYGIFKAIYAHGTQDNAWLMVGDPKQAIYSFRGADIYSYLDAGSQPGVERHTLGTNFRSTREMVAAVNQVFGYAEKTWSQGAFHFPHTKNGVRPIPFEAVEANDRTERLYQQSEHTRQAITGLRVWHLQNEGMAIGSGDFRAQMANIAANTIVDLLSQSQNQRSPKDNAVFFADNDGEKARCLAPSDIAILVSNRTEATCIQDALRVRGLQSVYLSDRDSILKTDEAQDLVIWLEAFLSPRDGRRIRSAMATRTLKLEFSSLDRLTTDEVYLDSVIERFVGYGSLWREKGILPALHQFMLDQELSFDLMGEPWGERTLTNLLHLSELLQREATQLDGQYGVLRYLRESIEDAREDEETVLRLESDSALIRVITIHKSKGLEFPLVFLPFVALSKPVDTQADYYTFHDENLKLKISLHAETNANPSPHERADGERLQESLRLLYVALTRACHACWVGIGPYKKGAGKTSGTKDTKKDDSTSLHHGGLGYLLKGGAPITIPELGGLLEAMAGKGNPIEIIPVEEEPMIAYRPPKKSAVMSDHRLRFSGPKVFETWRIDSYSRLLGYMANGDDAWGGSNENKAEAGSREGASSNLPGLHGFPAGPSHGDFLHKLLQKVGEAGFDRVMRDAEDRQRIIKESLSLQSYPKEWEGKLTLWLERFITHPLNLGETSIRLGDLNVRDCRMEMEFWFEIKKANLKDIDRVVTEHILGGQARPPLKEEHLNGMLKGFIDLIFRFNNQFYVSDYKSNQIGKTDAAFTKEAQDREILKHRYDLQYSLYTLALHRYLKSRIGAAYDYDHSVGGVAYFFLRGINNDQTHGVHFVKPPREMIEALDAIFSGDNQGVNHAA